MKTYRLRPEGFLRVKRRIIATGIPLGLVVVAVGLYFGAGGNLVVLLLTVPLFLGALVFAVYRVVRLERTRWSSYQLILGPDVVICRQAYLPEVVIHRDQVISLEEVVPDVGLAVRTADTFRLIFVPVRLDGYDEVKAHLSQWRTLESCPQRAGFSQLQILLISLLTVGVLTAIIQSENLRIVLPVGFLLVVAWLWGLIEAQRNPYIDARVKRWSWFALIPLLSVVGKIISLMK